MGDWSITIRGTGAHHNVDHPADADRMTKRFVEGLVAVGHHVRAATFTSGGETPIAGGYGAPLELDRTLRPTPGERSFIAYSAKRGGKNHDGTPTPTWDELGDGVREGWEAAAAAVLGS